MLAPVAEAAGIGLAIQQIDSSQFPKVRVYVSVADSGGVPITGLDDQAFQLVEDGKPVTSIRSQPIIDSQEPVAVVFIIDVSGSMNDAGKMDSAKQAATAFVDTMGPNDSAALISFSDTVKIDQGYTNDKAALKKAIAQLAAKGDTAIYDAVSQAAVLQGAVPQRRKVMLLMTDGDDNRSKQSLDGAISAAKASGAPLFAIGLGNDVKKDVLTRLATSTGGQAIFAATGDQLKQIFLSIGDQLRREYVIEYTSTLPADDQSHGLDVKATYRGQDSQVKGSFVAHKPQLALNVTGLTNATKVTGVQTINISLTSGSVQQIELLVDDKSEGTVTQAPFVFQWDTSKETAGIHKVVIRAKDPTGTTTDREFAVEVVPPTPAVTSTPARPAAGPTVAAVPSPTAVPTPVPAPASTNPIYYAIAGGVALVVIVGGLLAFLLLRRPRAPAPVSAPPPPAPREQPAVTDRTEAILPPVEATVVGGNATVISGMATPSTPRLPKGKLIVVQNGAKSEFTIQQAETILGREATNPVVIRDPMASRRHAKIVIENGEFWIEDLKSLNGTRVNGEVITRRKLVSNDQIKIGDATVTFVAE